MANNKQETDDELELDVNEKKGGSKTIIMVVVGILLLNGIGAGAWLFLSDGDDKKESGANPQAEVVLGPPKYLTLVPEFIVNFGPGSKVRYLQVDLQISTRQEASLDVISIYRPVIRNDVLVMLSSVSFDDLKTRDGKELLQKKLLTAINKVVNEAMHPANDKKDASKEEGHGNQNKMVKGPVDNVYFTSFIMQ